MRKTLNVVLAVVLALLMVGSMAYVVTPERTSEYQISLVSAKAVTVQDSTQGVRSYSDLVDTTKGFQVNEVINVAITAEVKNLEKPSTNNKYKSISGKTIKVVVGSPNIDFSIARLSTPTLLAHVWSGYTGQNVATVGYVMAAGEVLKYDKATNEISWKFKGYDMYAMNNSTSVGYNLVTFDPKIDDGKIAIPAIKLKDRKDKWSLGTWTYDTTYEAPESVAYTMVLTGVTMDNAGAATGEFYAKIEVSSAEKFDDETKYYVAYDGTEADTLAGLNLSGSLRTGQTTPLEWLDYVVVDVDKLEIAGSYTVYRYDIPASAVMADIPVIYGGDYDDFNGTDANNTVWTDGEIIARVQPQTWDFATSKSNKTTVDVAGGVKSMKAYDNYTSTTKSDYPVTSVVYSNNKAYYAPGYYGGIAGTGYGQDSYYSSKPMKGIPTMGDGTVTEDVTVVDYFYIDLDKNIVNTTNVLSTIQAWRADGLVVGQTGVDMTTNPTAIDTVAAAAPLGVLSYASATAGYYSREYTDPVNTVAYTTPQNVGNRLAEKNQYESEWTTSPLGSSYARLIVRPIGAAAKHTYPLTSNPTGNQWVVFYRDTAHDAALAVPVVSQPQASALLMPSVYDSSVAGSAPATGVAAPTIDTFVSGLEDAGPGSNSVAYEAYTGGAVPTATWTSMNAAARINYLNNTLSSTMLSWPMFTEVTTQATVAVGDKVVLSVGGLKDASDTSGLVWEKLANFPLTNEEQITAIRFFDTEADATIENDSTTVHWYAGNDINNAPAATGINQFAFGEAKVSIGSDGMSYVNLNAAYKSVWNAVSGVWQWERVSTVNELAAVRNTYVIVSINKGKVPQYTWDSKVAAPVNIWDIDSVADSVQDIKYHNGIVVYTICSNSNERPYLSMATESTTFDSDDGYGIALFDGYNADKLGHRIYRSNDSNLSYSDSAVGGHVNEGAQMIAAQKYFGLDTSYGTTFRVVDDAFENKGAAAVYSENVTGTFKYGELTIISEAVDEDTPAEEVVDDEPEDVVEPEEDLPEEPEDVPEDTTVEEPAPVAPATGDGSANVAIALAAAAIVAAAGLAFVMKKVR